MLRKAYVICLLLSAFLSRICAQQQNYVFQHLTTKDGLNSDFVQSVFQDSKGFYWISTTSGLQLFDGYTFSKPLRAGNDLMPISTITETSDGSIWISNQVSLYIYNRTNHQFKPVLPEGDKPVMALRVIEDSVGNIWLLNYSMLYKYDTTREKLISWLKLPESDQAMTRGSIGYNKEANVVWIQNGLDLYKIFPVKKIITRQEIMPHQAAYIWTDDDTHIWISFWTQYLCKYNIITGKKDWFTMPAKIRGNKTIQFAIATSFVRDKTGRLWIGTDGAGLWYFDELSNKVFQLKTDKYNGIIYSLTRDKEGAIWVGSDQGINIFNPSYQTFYFINYTNLPVENDIPYISQPPFETRTGDIIISMAYGGWLHYDSHFNIKKDFTNNSISRSLKNQLSKAIVTCFAEDKSGKIWIGHSGATLGIYEPQTGEIKYCQVKEFQTSKISDIKCDMDGNMWFTLRSPGNHLAKWDVEKKRFIIYNDSLLVKRGEQESSILITTQGSIWVQTFSNGFFRFDPANEKIAEIYRNEIPPLFIPNTIQNISQLNDSILGIASFAKGFFLFNSNQKTAVAINTDQGLPSNIARGIFKDRSGNLWMTTLSDLVRMDPITKKITSFDEEDGVVNKGFSDGFAKLRDGRVFIVSNPGLLYFHPDSIKPRPLPPDVLLTGLKIPNQPVKFDFNLHTVNNTVWLSYTQNFFTIDYVSLSYLNRKTIQYFYKMDGLESDWVNAGSNRFATYTNLGPGKYTFMVRAQNRDGISTNNITKLHIVITPPWWATWWAYSLYFLLAVAVAYFLYRTRIFSLKQKQQAEIKAMVATQEDERKRISRDLHDDVGTKLSALKLFLSSLHEKAIGTNNEEIKSLAKNSEQFITEAMQDVRQLLLNLSPTVLEEFGYTTAIEGLVNKINETKQIQFDLVVFGMKQRLQKDYELALYRITQELINNVLKHAAAKNVSLQIGQRDEKIVLMMEDDGIGFDVAAHKYGYGLNNLYARTKLMHGTMTIDSQPGKGTSILIEVPYNFS